jgi:hypothetical protein
MIVVKNIKSVTYKSFSVRCQLFDVRRKLVVVVRISSSPCSLKQAFGTVRCGAVGWCTERQGTVGLGYWGFYIICHKQKVMLIGCGREDIKQPLFTETILRYGTVWCSWLVHRAARDSWFEILRVLYNLSQTESDIGFELLNLYDINS